MIVCKANTAVKRHTVVQFDMPHEHNSLHAAKTENKAKHIETTAISEDNEHKITCQVNEANNTEA